MFLPRLLSDVVAHCRRHAARVLLIGLALAIICGLAASWRLGVTTDTDRLFSDSLPWRQREIAFERDFPQFHDLLVVVIDAAEPEEADQTAAALTAALSQDTTHFQGVRRPDNSPYFDTEGLMLLDTQPLQDGLDHIIDAQPFLGQLVADPSARGLFAALGLLGIGAQQDPTSIAAFDQPLLGFHQALAAAVAGHPAPLSWQKLLGGGMADKAGPYRFVLIQPRLDFGALEPGGAATQAVRDAAARLPYVQSGAAHVRITGSVALADEEFATVAQGALAGTIASVLLITLWLILAVRSWRLILPILLTLAAGLTFTTGFAAIVVGTLNLISIAFAILFVGIAVDFSIQFCVRLREIRRVSVDFAAALQGTAATVGPQILVAAAAAAAGFLAFVPTDFSGVAELGLIAGFGMVIAFVCTVTILPAALRLFQPRDEAREVGFAVGGAAEAWLFGRRRLILPGFLVLAVLGVIAVPRLTFDSDPLHTKNPNTQAMQTLHDLMDSPLTSPYSVDILAPSQEAADALAKKLSALPLVAQVVTLSSFVPTDQTAKLAAIADAANLLQATLAPRAAPAAPATPADLRLAAQTTGAQISAAAAKLPKDSPLAAIGADLVALGNAPDSTLMAANQALTQFLPAQLAQLRQALTAHPVTAADLPPEIVRDWKLPDGRVRVQATAKSAARDSAGLAAFVAQIRTVAPDAGGSAVGIVESARTILGAFRSAAIGALIAIAVILALVLRRTLDVALVMMPLLLSALMTALIAVLLPLPLNFANIIALPLLLGVGVSFNIYFVMNWRAGVTRFLGTATTRAILFSALTTGTAFGSLAASRHPGTASMGELLLLSLACTLIATLVFMPTLLRTLNNLAK